MATSSEDAIGLKQALDYDGLQKQLVDLQNSFKEISEKNTTLQYDADKAKTELEALKSLKLATEHSKTEIEEKLKDLVQNESRLREINTKTYDALCEKRESLQKVQEELGNLRQREIEKTIEVEAAKSTILKLTDTKHDLESKLSIIIHREQQISQELKSLRREYENNKSDNISDRNRLLEQITDLKREKEYASDSADQLRLQLNISKQKLVDYEDQLNTITRDRDQVKLNLGSTSKSYKDLLALYDEHVTHTDMKISNCEAKTATIKAEKELLERKLNDLERQLDEEKELRKIHFKQLTGAVESTTNGADSSSNGSNLLKLIQEYQQQNSHPEDIFQDYFELKAKYNKVLLDNQHATSIADNLTRKLNDNENLFNRLHRELTAAKEQVNDLQQSLSNQKSTSDRLEKNNKNLTNTVNDLTQEKKNLEASLKDTTYQLQYLLSDIQRRNEPIPMALKDSAELLGAAQVIPGLAHDQLVYKNVAELQDLNTKLVGEVRNLTQKVQATSTEISSAISRRNTDVETYKAALAEAKQTTTDLSTKANDLQKKLDTLTTECNNYKALINQLGDGDAKARFEEMKQNQERQREQMDISFETYRQETSQEINKLKEELESTRASASESRAQLTQVNVEIAHLRRKQTHLNNTIEQKEDEIKNYKRQTTTYQERVATRDRELMEVKEELSDFKSKTEVLRNENHSLTVRLESVTSAYNTTKELASQDSAEKAHMSHLLEVINSRMDSIAANNSGNMEHSKETIEKLNRELQYTRDTLAMAEKELDGYKSIDQQEIKDKYKESVIEIRLLKTKMTELEQQLSNVNQDRIIAQTKLADAEEQLKKLSADESSTATATATTAGDASCDEHVRLLAQAEDRIRVLEGDIEKYHGVIADNDKKADQLVKDHEKFVNKSQVTINELLKQLEVKTTEAANAQGEAEKSIAEFKILHEKDVATQAELTTEKRTLEEKVKALDADNLAKETDLVSLRQTAEEKTTACTEAETKLATEIMTNEEHRQTINTLRADVSKLTFEISEYKSKANASTTAMESLKADYDRAAGERAEFEENLKKSLAESEKQREKLVDRVEELVKKHTEWQILVTHDNGGNAAAEAAGFEGATKDILQQLREANETLRIERDANENKYRYEHNNLKRVEAELVPVKHQAAHLQAECDRLREEIKNFNAAGKEESSTFRMQCDAFKSQNQALIKENEILREKKEQAQADLDKKNAEIAPLNVKISTLEGQLQQSRDELAVLTKSQKEWSSRSAQLLSKYNRVDPAEIDKVKADLEITKTELDTIKAQKIELESNIVKLETTVKDMTTEKTGLVQKCNDRGRFAMEFKKKANEAERKLVEAERKLKVAETANANANTQNDNTSKLVKEKETAELTVKRLEEEKKKADEAVAAADKAKAAALEEAKKAEDALTVRMNEFSNLQTKYKSILERARGMQQDNKKFQAELKALKAAEGDAAEIATLRARIAEIEQELATGKKTIAEHIVEVSKLKAQNSMALNKSARLQKEIDNLKAAKSSSGPSESTLSANAPVFQVSSPTIGSPSSAANASPQLGHATNQAFPKVVASAIMKSKSKEASGVNTPELSTTPAPAASVGTPVLTPVSVSTPPPTTATTTTTTTEEPAVSTPVADSEIIPSEVDELVATEAVSATTPSAAAEVEADLSMEEESTEAEVNKDIADESTTADAAAPTSTAATEENNDLIDESQVEIEVHEVVNDKVDSPQLDASEETALDTAEVTDDSIKNIESVDSPVVLQEVEEEVSAEAPQDDSTAADNATNATTNDEVTTVEDEGETLEPTIGSKRKERPEEEEGEEGELTAESPTKKVHTNTDEK